MEYRSIQQNFTRKLSLKLTLDFSLKKTLKNKTKMISEVYLKEEAPFDIYRKSENSLL